MFKGIHIHVMYSENIQYIFIFQIYNYYHLACEPGYSGVNCKLKCPFPLYGSECQMRCTCKAEHCDFANGCKSSYGIFITVINVLYRFLIKAKRYL